MSISNWRVSIAETLTGRIVAAVQPADVPTFTRELCGKGDWSVSLIVDKEINRSIDLHTYATSDAYSWIIDYGGYILQAGPVTSATYSESDHKLSVSGSGIGGLFDQRVLRNHTGDPAAITDPANNLSYTGLTLATILRNLIVENLAQRNYHLPITVPDPETGEAERNYEAADLATVWDRITKLAEVINGPEFDFAPYYWSTDDRVLSLGWELRLGAPQLGDPELPAAWDYGGALGTIDVDLNAAIGPVHRVWVKGEAEGDTSETTDTRAGEGDEDTNPMIVGYAENSDALAALGYPGADYVDSDHTSVTEIDTANAYAASGLDEFATPSQTWTVTVRIDGRSRSGALVAPQLGEWNLGDWPIFRVSGHPWLANTETRMRILGIANDTASTLALTLGEFPLIL